MHIKHILLPSLLLASTLLAHADISSDFSTGDEGWSVRDLQSSDLSTLVGTYPVVHHASGGNPDGFIASNDPSDYSFYFSAPAKFLGDRSTSFGLTLSYDLSNTGTQRYSEHADLIIEGAGKRLFNDLLVSPTADWQSYMTTLDVGHGWKLGSTAGAAASAQDIKDVLGSLDSLLICGEYTWGAETSQLDNVVLAEREQQTTVPDQASTLGLAGIAFASLAFLRRRR